VRLVDPIKETVLSRLPSDLRSHGEVTLMERLPAGGGAANWFVLRSESQIDELVSLLTPGSRIALLAAPAVSSAKATQETHRHAYQLAAEHDEVVLGVVGPGVVATVGLLAPSELDEAFRTIPEGADVLLGVIPGLDGPGFLGWLLLPDADGVVRPHPH
jgi:hypothetical protein